MPTQIRFLGVAGYEIITSQNKHILIDPFLDNCPGAPFASDTLTQVDLILVSHAAFDFYAEAGAGLCGHARHLLDVANQEDEA